MKEIEVINIINEVLTDNNVEKESIKSETVIGDMVMADKKPMDSLDWTVIILDIEIKLHIEIPYEVSGQLFGGSLSEVYKYVKTKVNDEKVFLPPE